MSAPEIHRVSTILSIWQAYEPAVKVHCTSTALRTPEGVLLFDPIALAPAALDEIVQGEKIAGLVLTSGNHQRASLELREARGVPIFAPAAAQGEVEADHWIEPGDTIASSLTVVALPGAGPGEMAFHGLGCLIVGDSLIHLGGLEILPAKYCENPRTLKKSLLALLPLDYQTLCFAHGLPIVHQARERLGLLLGV